MKRKRNSKIISLLLAVMMIVTSLPFAGMSALAEESGDFEYEILDDGTAEITAYNGEAETLEIPATLNGYTVTSIGDYAFNGCGSLTSITIPNGVTNIGSRAFEDCDSLTSIIIPDSVTSIGYEAFHNCYSLTSVTIPNSVTNIGASAFWETGYYNDDANWENGVLYIGNHLIEANYEVPDEYSINEGTVTIADSAFEVCYSLISVTIPSSVTIIGDSAFEACGSLTSITIPNSVTSIGDYAFYYCESLTSVTIPDNIISIGYRAFNGCRSLTSIIVDENNNAYFSQDGVLFNKEKTELIQYPIGNERTSYGIPNGVTNIDDAAFASNYYITSVTIPDSVTSIGDEAFAYCSSLTSIKIPESVTNIGDYAFVWCDSLASIDIGKCVESIGDNAFKGCGIKSVTIRGDLTAESSLFYNSDLENITFAYGVTAIPAEICKNCSKLKSVTISDSVTNIGEGAFSDCDSLTSITIPDSVTRIGDNAFDGSALETIYGYENSYAQTYAEENGYEFVPLYTYENEESGITVDTDKSELPADTELAVTVKEITEYSITYDISLRSGDTEVQPTGSLKIKIPVPETMDGRRLKVYRIEADGTMTDMNAIYKNGYMVFTAEQFGEYMLKAPSGTIGDVNVDGKINALDVLIVKRYIAKYDDAKLEGDQFALADVNCDGKVNAKDAFAIMQKIAKLIDSFDEIK